MKKILVVLFILLLFSFYVDDGLSLTLNDNRSEILDFSMTWFYTIFSSLVVFIIMSLILFKNKNKLYLMWLSFFSTGVLHIILKFIINRVRPFMALNLDKLNGINYNFAFWNTSFPSWHTAAVFLLFPFIKDKSLEVKIAWFVFALLAGFNRVYLGLHYLSDVIGGVIVGLLMGYIFIFVNKKYKIVRI